MLKCLKLNTDTTSTYNAKHIATPRSADSAAIPMSTVSALAAPVLVFAFPLFVWAG